MGEIVTKCYFNILSFPEQKKSGGSGISYIITMAIYIFPEVSKYYFEK